MRSTERGSRRPAPGCAALCPAPGIARPVRPGAGSGARAGLAAMALLAVLATAGCLAEPAKREPTQPPGTVSSASDPSAVSCVSEGAPAFTIAAQGLVTNPTSLNRPLTDARAFLIGLPCRQASVDADGSFTLALTEGDATAAGLGAGSQPTLVVWLVETPFDSVVAASTAIRLESGTTTLTQPLTLAWAQAAHVSLTAADGSTVVAATFVGISDSAAHGFAMTRFPGAFGNAFDSNYLPPGTYEVELETDQGAKARRRLYFPAGGGRGAWFFPTLAL